MPKHPFKPDNGDDLDEFSSLILAPTNAILYDGHNHSAQCL
ncbi:hypothetical protein CEXT_649521, partial [Caerostris extrusa]